MKRYAMRIDGTQKEIVAGLRAVGVQVWHIGQPCDLLTLYRGRWLPLECKRPGAKRKDQPKQDAFIAQTGVKKVTTIEEAIEAVIP